MQRLAGSFSHFSNCHDFWDCSQSHGNEKTSCSTTLVLIKPHLPNFLHFYVTVHHSVPQLGYLVFFYFQLPFSFEQRFLKKKAKSKFSNIHSFSHPEKYNVTVWTTDLSSLPFPLQWACEANPICPPYLRLNSAIRALYGFRIMRMLDSKASISFLPLSCVLMHIVLPLLQWSRSPLNPMNPIVYLLLRQAYKLMFVNNIRHVLGPTFIVKGAIKVIAACVEASGELYEVASPGVASSGETGKSHQMLSTSGKEMSVHTAVIW